MDRICFLLDPGSIHLVVLASPHDRPSKERPVVRHFNLRVWEPAVRSGPECRGIDLGKSCGAYFREQWLSNLY